MTKFLLPSEILVATHNKGKFIEISELLWTIKIKAISPFSLGIKEPEETEDSFAKNSILKAKYYASISQICSLADDSGLCIEDLNGAPGVHSARFAIDEKTGQKNFPLAFAKIEQRLAEKNIAISSRPKACFICSLSLFDPKSNVLLNFEGRVDGHLTFPAKGKNGFGYDPIFVKDGMSQTFGEIDPKLKDSISHRAIAFDKMIKSIFN